MLIKISAEFWAKIQKRANRGTWSELDDFNPCDSSGGNFDDAYYGGQDDGETEAARELRAVATIIEEK